MSENGNRIHVVVIQGSVRSGNNTAKAATLVVEELEKTDGAVVDVVDPTSLRLPLPGERGNHAEVEAMRETVSRATGVIFVTPEYHGSFSSVTKLIIDNLDFPSALAGKPIALAGVAAGAIGAIKALEHLRSVCSHVGGIVLPGPVSVANVRSVFDAGGNCLDPSVESRLRGLVKKLIDYIVQSACPDDCLERSVRVG
jgi:FMN reductase